MLRIILFQRATVMEKFLKDAAKKMERNALKANIATFSLIHSVLEMVSSLRVFIQLRTSCLLKLLGGGKYYKSSTQRSSLPINEILQTRVMC